MHVHHGLQKIADSWVPHCEKICADLNIPLEVAHLKLAIIKGESTENIARKGRYEALKASLQADEILVTAHHQNDQAETLLLQLFRGAGVQGLASMPLINDFGLGQQVRPLLAESRDDLECYAKKHQLQFIDDPSNQDQAFDRNFLRQNILPQLRKRWLGIDKSIARSARIQAETKALLDEVAQQDLDKICDEANTITIQSLLKLSKRRQKLLIRYWIEKGGFSSPSEKKLQHIFDDGVHAKEDAQPLIAWQGAEIRRFKGQLYVLQPLSKHDASQQFDWQTQTPLIIASLGVALHSEMLNEPFDHVSVRFRQGGEQIYLPERGIHLSLKNYFHEMAVPPWLRDRAPLIYHENTLKQVILEAKSG